MSEAIRLALLAHSLLNSKPCSSNVRELTRQVIEAMRSFPRWPWLPNPGAQMVAYLTQADELYYGGAAGGGKSQLLLGLALTAHRKSLILRREAAQLQELIEALLTLAGPHDRWRSQGQGGLLRTADGRQIELAGCQRERDKEKYKGRPHDLKAFDEGSDFTQSQYEFICAWNRTTDSHQRCRRVIASNPPTTSAGGWVVERFAPWLQRPHPRPAAPAELRWFARLPNGTEIERPDGLPFSHNGALIKPMSRTFIPARLEDNPHLALTSYGATLEALPEPLRSMLRYGDFTTRSPDSPWQVIPTEWVIAAQKRWQTLDQMAHAHGRSEHEPGPLEAIGLDVARGGENQTVIARRHGRWFAPLVKYKGMETPDGPRTAGKVLEILAAADRPEDLRTVVYVDVVGVGASVFDSLRSVQIGKVRVVDINFSRREERLDRAGVTRFRNLRAWAWWSLREALDPDKGDHLALPPDSELLADLTAVHWQSTGSGGILAEPKDNVKKRLKRSPDCGDAVVLAALKEDDYKDWKLEIF